MKKIRLINKSLEYVMNSLGFTVDKEVIFESVDKDKNISLDFEEFLDIISNKLKDKISKIRQ